MPHALPNSAGSGVGATPVSRDTEVPGVAFACFSDREPVGWVVPCAGVRPASISPEPTPSPAQRGLASANGADSGMGAHASGCGREAPAPDAAALPCQNSNNSDKRPRYRLRPVSGNPDVFTDGSEGRCYMQVDADTVQRYGFPTSAEAKAAFQLRLNVASFVQHYGRNRCLFFTVTDEDNLHPRLFARRWNHYLRRNGAWIESFIRVLEPQKQGRPHYHLLVAVPWDTQPDKFDWAAFDECQRERKQNGHTARFRELRACYKQSAAPELVALWGVLRKVLPRYGLGRSELLPLRKGKEAVSEYVGKYLQAGLALRKHSWKGCRRIETDRRNKSAWLACTRVFAWHSPGASAWRKRVAEVAAAVGASDLSSLRERLGSRWAYRLREAITLSSEVEWVLFLRVLAQSALGVSQR